MPPKVNKPIDGSSVLDEVRTWFGRYLATVNDSDLDLLALWTLHTHVVMETYTTPRLLIDSPVPGSGKTTCLEHLNKLCVAPVQMASLSSPALLARMLNDQMRTLLIDEADRTLDPKKDGVPELLAVLNSGYKRGGTRPVLVPVKGGGWESAEMPTFSPVALAGNNPLLPEDTKSRTIRVLLLPDRHGTVAESDWEMIDAAADALAARVASWAEAHRDLVRTTRPEMPEGIIGRLREKWQPLARVAAAAGGRWPAAVAAMAVQDREQIELDREDGMVAERPHVVLLRHLAEVWPDDHTFCPSQHLVELLVREHPSAWSEESSYGRRLTVQRFGRMLATSYKLNSGRERKDGPRGYYLNSLLPLWSRMGIAPPIEPAQPAEPAEPAPTREPVAPLAPVGPVQTGGVRAPAAPACPLVWPDGRPHRHHPMPGCWSCDGGDQ